MKDQLEQLAREYIESIAPSDPDFDISTLQYEYDIFLKGAEAAVKLFESPEAVVCSCDKRIPDAEDVSICGNCGENLPEDYC